MIEKFHENHKKKNKLTEFFKGNKKKIVNNKNKLIHYDTVIYGLIFYVLISPEFLILIQKFVPNKHIKIFLSLLFALIYFLKSKYYDK